MCTYSMVVTGWQDGWQDYVTPRTSTGTITSQQFVPTVEELERQAAAYERLLTLAKKYDEDHHEKECEQEEKKETLKQLAKQLGVTISFP